jgi:hypothetical protein
MISRAIAYAREQALSELLINVSALAGFDPPPLVDRYFLTAKSAEMARGKLRVVLVASAEMIDPAKFGVTLATNLGFVFDIFATETEAVAWLDRLPEVG